MRLLSALLIGLLFGMGILVSGMCDPAKVLNFFDVAGPWDPSLAFVMAGGLAVNLVGYRLAFGRNPCSAGNLNCRRRPQSRRDYS